MALIKCPECGKEVSDSAKICPHCGYPLNKNKAVEQEVINVERTFSGEPEEIKRYRKEIELCYKRRFVMITIGSILAGLSILLMILFSVLVLSHVIRMTFLWYYFLIVMLCLATAGGIALIVVGAVTNSVKIKKRENRIRLWERNR